jgi:dipeptidase
VRKKDGIWFAKNSGCDPNEAQVVEWHSRQRYESGARLNCTCIEIPQVEETNGIVISRPVGGWGANMGANEHHVTIGNTVVFTDQPVADNGLTGPDLVRVALERATNAREAVSTITSLIQQHGQGDGHNSFIVADPEGALVIETAGELFAVEAVQGVCAISNSLAILAVAEHGDRKMARLYRSEVRRGRCQDLAYKTRTELHLFATLRDHGGHHQNPQYHWRNGAMGGACMHAGGLLAGVQTTGSWVSHFAPDGSVRHWTTGTAAPCTGLFKPVSVDQPLQIDESLWWRHERFHRTVMRNPERLRERFLPERNRIEAEWIESPPDPEEAFKIGDELLTKWMDVVAAEPVPDVRPWWVRRYWRKKAVATPNI